MHICGSVLMKHNKMLMVRSGDDIKMRRTLLEYKTVEINSFWFPFYLPWWLKFPRGRLILSFKSNRVLWSSDERAGELQVNSECNKNEVFESVWLSALCKLPVCSVWAVENVQEAIEDTFSPWIQWEKKLIAISNGTKVWKRQITGL